MMCLVQSDDPDIRLDLAGGPGARWNDEEAAGVRRHTDPGGSAPIPGATVRTMSGRLTVDRPPAVALRLFTAVGERDWVQGWVPRFPVRSDDDTAPGTVFETSAHGATTTWIVLDREPGLHIRYARTTPLVSAGTVAVTLEGDGPRSVVTVTYTLTPLSVAGREQVDALAADFDAFLAGWQEAIARLLAGSP
jgi:hypothetical protein